MPSIEQPFTRGRAILTTSWDDGHPLDLRVADMLARHGIAGTFYVPREAPHGTMGPAQLRGLSCGFEIGAHTLLHAELTRLPSSRSWREVAGSKSWVEDQIGRPCRMFCPPRGRFSRLHTRMASRAGFLGLRSVELVSLALPQQVNGIWLMPTSVQACDHAPSDYLRNLSKRAAFGNLWWYIGHGWGRSWSRVAFRLLTHIAESGGVFHLWGHSWELEEEGQWQRLDLVLRWMRSLATPGSVLTNGAVCEWARERNEALKRRSGARCAS